MYKSYFNTYTIKINSYKIIIMWFFFLQQKSKIISSLFCCSLIIAKVNIVCVVFVRYFWIVLFLYMPFFFFFFSVNFICSCSRADFSLMCNMYMCVCHPWLLFMIFSIVTCVWKKKSFYLNLYDEELVSFCLYISLSLLSISFLLFFDKKTLLQFYL